MKSARRIGFFPRCGSNEGDVPLERENIFPLPAGSEKRGNFPRFHPRAPRIFPFLYPVFRSAEPIEFHRYFPILKRSLFKSYRKGGYRHVVKLSSRARISTRENKKQGGRPISSSLSYSEISNLERSSPRD